MLSFKPFLRNYGSSRALCDSGCTATSFLQLSKQRGRRNIHVTPDSIPSHSLISEVYTKTNLGGLGVILETDVENTAKG